MAEAGVKQLVQKAMAAGNALAKTQRAGQKLLEVLLIEPEDFLSEFDGLKDRKNVHALSRACRFTAITQVFRSRAEEHFGTWPKRPISWL
mmetsp:Transcript_54316/g.87944  ORF Transcript_54316/g.87944 Transcript_54316/m.87944 type:complete len:90 (+) Transcript_54316:314-583(+)